MEEDIWQYYQTNRPGQVQVLAADLFNGSAAANQQFRNTTGVTFPILLQGAAGAGAENLLVTYGDRDNYCVINKQGIVRYHAYDLWPYGNRYHLDQLRGCIDSLVTAPASVDPWPASSGLSLSITPNPVGAAATIELSHPFAGAADARVELFDLTGRRVQELWHGAAAPGETRIPWRATRGTGEPLAPGVYTLRAEIDGRPLTRRVVLLPR